MTKSQYSSLLFLSFLFHFFISNFNVSASSNLVSRDGGKLLYSTRANFPAGASLTVEVVDLSRPELLPNGQYSEFIVQHATEVVKKYLEKHGNAKFEVPPFSESFFSGAFEQVLVEMDVDMNVLMPAIFNELVSEYTKIAQRYNQKIRKIVPGSAEFEKRLQDVKLATIVAQEASVNSFKFTESQAAILLEFIYRFGVPGPRHGLAIQSLYTSIPARNLAAIYKMFVDHFDPTRQPLPVLFIHVQDPKLNFVKQIFIDFIRNLYTKVDQITDTEIFNNHSCMMISSMISCNFFTDFEPMIINLLQRTDMIKLGSSPRFARSAIEISKIQNDSVVNEIARLLIDRNVILALNRDVFIDHGSIIFHIKQNQPEIYDSYFNQLSPEAQERLIVIEEVYTAYFNVISESNVFDTLEETFPSMQQTDLNNLSDSIDKMLPVFPDYFKHQNADANTVVIKVLDLLQKLVNISMRQSSKDLDIFRFKLFVKLLELAFTEPFLLESTPEIFSTVLCFYNLRFNSQSRHNPILKEVHIKVLFLISKLIEKNKFFRTHRYRSNFYTYLKLVVPQNAEFSMTGCLFEVLSLNADKYLLCNDLIISAKKLELPIQTEISLFLSRQIQKYLQDHSSVAIEKYLDGSLVNIFKVILMEKLLSKSETILIKTIINKFASHTIFTE